MKTKEIILGAVLIFLAIWVFINMEDVPKYFGSGGLVVFGLIMLFMGFKKEKKEAPAPPEPMKPDEHTPTEKTEPIQPGHETDQILEDDYSEQHSYNQDDENQH